MTKYGKILALLSIFDLVFTLTGIHLGFINEWNRVNAHIIVRHGAVTFSIYHLFFAAFGILLLESLWQLKQERQPTWHRYYLFINYTYCIVFFSTMIVQPLYYMIV